MIDETLIEKINKEYSSLSKNHKKISDFILESKEKAVFLTVKELSKKIGVGESTIIRFSTRLGYGCYQDFQKNLVEVIKVESTATKRINATIEKINRSEKHIIDIVLESEIGKIKKTSILNSKKKFDEIIEYIPKAQNIYILGNRSSYSIANYFTFYLNFILDNVRLLEFSDGSEIMEHSSKINEGDLLIVLSFPRYSKKTIEIVREIKKRNCKILGITDSKTSPITKYTDDILLAVTDMISIVDSLVAPFSLINAILIGISLKDTDRIKNRFNDLEEIWRKYDIYYSREDK